MALGKNIRQMRLARGWDLAALSERSGVDVGTISALEMRDSKRSQFVAHFAEAFGVTLSQLMQGEDAPPAKKPGPVVDGLSTDAVEVARAWMRLPDYKRRGYAQGIMVDAAVVEVFPELERAMRAAAVASDPSYHRMTDGFRRAREQLRKQMELDFEAAGRDE